MSDDEHIHRTSGSRSARADSVRAAAPALAPRPRRPAAQAQGPQAAAVLDPLRPRRAGAGLDPVRDDDGGRLRPARSSRTSSSTSRTSNSYLYDDQWRPIGIFAPPNHVVIDTYGQISPSMKDAIVSVEDKRFWTDPGVDIRGIAPRASWPTSPAAPPRAPRRSPSSSSRTRSPSRTTARSSRSCARRRWPTTSPASGPRTKILTEYLNSIYFGNGAYGVESAARVYFGKIHGLRPERRRCRAAPAAAGTRRPGTRSRRAPRCSRRGRRRCWPGWSPTRRRSIRSPIPRRRRPAATWCSTTCSSRATSSRAQYEQGINEPLPNGDRHRAARGAGGGAVLHELAAAPDPGGDGPGTASRLGWPSTAPTTAG